MHWILKINPIPLISDQMHFLYLIFYLIDICIQLSNMKLFMVTKFNENILFQQAYVINLKGEAKVSRQNYKRSLHKICLSDFSMCGDKTIFQLVIPECRIYARPQIKFL